MSEGEEMKENKRKSSAAEGGESESERALCLAAPRRREEGDSNRPALSSVCVAPPRDQRESENREKFPFLCPYFPHLSDSHRR